MLVWLLVVLAYFLLKPHLSAADEKILADWAEANGYELLEIEPRRFWCGRFTLLRSNQQRIYRVCLKDRHGRIWGGYLRVGGFFGGGTYVSEDLDDPGDDA